MAFDIYQQRTIEHNYFAAQLIRDNKLQAEPLRSRLFTSISHNESLCQELIGAMEDSFLLRTIDLLVVGEKDCDIVLDFIEQGLEIDSVTVSNTLFLIPLNIKTNTKVSELNSILFGPDGNGSGVIYSIGMKDGTYIVDPTADQSEPKLILSTGAISRFTLALNYLIQVGTIVPARFTGQGHIRGELRRAETANMTKIFDSLSQKTYDNINDLGRDIEKIILGKTTTEAFESIHKNPVTRESLSQEDALLEQYEVTKSQVTLLEILRINPQSPVGLYYSSQHHENERDMRKELLIKAFNNIEHLGDNSNLNRNALIRGEIIHQLGTIYQEDGQYTEAIEVFSKMMNTNDNYEVAFDCFHRAVSCKLTLGDFKEAKGYLRMVARKDDQDDVFNLVARAIIYLQEYGVSSKFKTAVKKLYEVNPYVVKFPALDFDPTPHYDQPNYSVGSPEEAIAVLAVYGDPLTHTNAGNEIAMFYNEKLKEAITRASRAGEKVYLNIIKVENNGNPLYLYIAMDSFSGVAFFVGQRSLVNAATHKDALENLLADPNFKTLGNQFHIILSFGRKMVDELILSIKSKGKVSYSSREGYEYFFQSPLEEILTQRVGEIGPYIDTL